MPASGSTATICHPKASTGDGQHQRHRDRLCAGRGRGLLPRRAAGAFGASHHVTDLTLGLGEVVFDYLKDA
jgi:hypothetical protein